MHACILGSEVEKHFAHIYIYIYIVNVVNNKVNGQVDNERCRLLAPSMPAELNRWVCYVSDASRSYTSEEQAVDQGPDMAECLRVPQPGPRHIHWVHNIAKSKSRPVLDALIAPSCIGWIACLAALCGQLCQGGGISLL